MILQFPQRFQEVSQGTESGEREATSLQATRVHLHPSYEVFFRLSSPAQVSCSDDGCQRKAAVRIQIWNCDLSDQSNDYCCVHANAVAARFEWLVRSLCQQYPDHSLRKPHREDGTQESRWSTAPPDTSRPIPEMVFTVRFLYDPAHVDSCIAGSCSRPGIAETNSEHSSPPRFGSICEVHLIEAVSGYHRAIQRVLSRLSPGLHGR